jgi:hypothetical protein
MFIAGTLLVSFCLGAPAMGVMARPFALEQVSTIDTSVSALEEALAKNDWEAMAAQTGKAESSLTRVLHGPAIKALTTLNQPPTVDELRDETSRASEALASAQQAIRQKDAEQLQSALAKFRKAYEPLREAAKNPPR